jgi:hypothetical protein
LLWCGMVRRMISGLLGWTSGLIAMTRRCFSGMMRFVPPPWSIRVLDDVSSSVVDRGRARMYDTPWQVQWVMGLKEPT